MGLVMFGFGLRGKVFLAAMVLLFIAWRLLTLVAGDLIGFWLGAVLVVFFAGSLANRLWRIW